jgi:hypothetical protein
MVESKWKELKFTLNAANGWNTCDLKGQRRTKTIVIKNKCGHENVKRNKFRNFESMRTQPNYKIIQRIKLKPVVALRLTFWICSRASVAHLYLISTERELNYLRERGVSEALVSDGG